MEKINLLCNYVGDLGRQREDRVLTKQERREIEKRWADFMPDEEPLYYKDINHFRSLNLGRCVYKWL